MDIDRAVTTVAGFLETHIKNQNYFSEKADHGNKLTFKSAVKGKDGKTITLTFIVGEVWSIHDPGIRRVARSCTEAACTAQPQLEEFEFVREFVQ